MSGEEPAWVRIQKKTFTRWCNNYLTQRTLSINDLQTDLADGVNLHALLEILGNEDVLPKVNKKAKLKLQKVENLNTCLRYIKSKNINLVNIGAEDLHDGKIKLILGLIWTLILRFQIMAEDEESAGARAALLEWCNSVLNPQGLYVKNFTGDWQDGRCFCGLVNAIEPNQIPLNTVPASEAEKNMNRAFNDAEKLFGFPQVLDAIDVIENADDLSIMTYVSYFRAYMLANNAFGPNCTAEGPGLTEATTFEKAPFTVTTYNEEGERVERGGAMLKCSLVDDAGAEVTKINVTDNRNGTYSCYYVAERPGKFKLNILIKKDNIKNSPFSPQVRPGEPFPGNCEAHGPGISNATAGVEVGFTVVTKDVGGNLLPRGGANISAVLHDPKGDIKVNIKDNGDGTYAATYTPKTAGTSRLDVTVATQFNGTGPIKNSPFNVSIVPGKADPNNFDWEGLELDADGRRVVVAGTTDSFKVIAKDGNGNRLTSGGLNVNGKISNGPAPIDVKVADGNDGSYGLSYTPIKTGDYSFLVSLDSTPLGGKKNPFTVRCIPAEPSAPHSPAVGEGLKYAVAGKATPYTIQSKDRFENNCVKGGAQVRSELVHESGTVFQGEIKDNGDGTYEGTNKTATKAGTYKLTPTINGAPIKDAPFTLVVHPSEADPSKFEWVGLQLDAQGRRVVVAGTTDKFTVIAKDTYGNRQEKGGLNVNGVVSKGPADVKVATKDNTDGSYELSYTPNKVGTYQFQVNLDNTAVGGHANPFPLLVVPATAGGRSVATGPGLKNAEVGGKNNKFTVETRDDFDNKVTQGGADVKAELVNDATGEKTPVSIKDNGDGTYSAEYAGVNKAGDYTLTPTVNGKTILEAPFKVKVNPGGFDPNNTGVEIPNPGFAGRRGPKVSVKDNQGNLRAGFDDDVEADLTPKIKIPKVKAKSNGDGTYDIDYPANLMPGDYEIDIRVNGQQAPKAPFTGPVKLKELTPEHSAELQKLVPAQAAVFNRLLLNATDAEREAVLAALRK